MKEKFTNPLSPSNFFNLLLQKNGHHLQEKLQETSQKLENKAAEFHTIMNYLTNILNHISQGLIFISLDGTITTYNPAAEKMFNEASEKVLFNQFSEIFPDQLLGFSMRKALKERVAPETTFIKYTHEKEYEVTTSFVIEGKEEIPLDFTKGLIILIRDITEIRRLQLIAERNHRLKELGEMAAMMAHEIRNPLGGIKGFASLLVRDLKQQPEMQKMAHSIVEGTDHLNHLVNNILNYTHPIEINPEMIDLVALAYEVQEHLRMDISLNKGIKISVLTEEQEIFLPLDITSMKSVLLNLVVNAIQAIPEQGEVKILLSEKGKIATIDVVDNGTGIAPENLEKIFSPFFTTKPEGNGFGLAEVYKIVLAHHGTIEVQSTLGQGTRFIIKIPVEKR